MATHQAVRAFATKLANTAETGAPYSMVEQVQGKNVIIIGIKYNITVFTIDGLNCAPHDSSSTNTRGRFRNYVIASIINS